MAAGLRSEALYKCWRAAASLPLAASHRSSPLLPANSHPHPRLLQTWEGVKEATPGTAEHEATHPTSGLGTTGTGAARTGYTGRDPSVL